MADGVAITAGSGTTILTDDTGAGGHAQVMKLAISTDGSATLVPADAANGLDVDVTRVTGTVTVDSELPAAAALADGAANPTVPGVGAAGLLYNGSTWDRARGDTTNGAWVNVKAGTQSISGHVPGTNSDQLGKAEDSASTNGDTVVAMGVVRQSEANSLTSSAGSDGDYAFINADARGLLQIVNRPYVVRQRQPSSGLTTASTSYAIGDTAGTIYTFTGAARVSAGTGTLLSAVLVDKGDVGTDYRLHVYRSSVTLSNDNAAWAVSDADQQELIGILTMPSMLDVGANRVSTLANIGLPYDCAATSLFVGVETRTANGVYAAATDLNLILTYALD